MIFFVQIKTFSIILHVLSVVVGMGGALIADLLFSFYSKNKRLNSTEIKTLHLLSKIVWISLFFITISGLFIFLSNPEKYMASSKFLTKMTIIGFITINGIILDKIVWSHVILRNFFTSKSESLMRKVAFTCGAVSVTSWILACVLGSISKVPLSYPFMMSIYGIILLGAVSVSLIIERFSFEKTT